MKVVKSIGLFFALALLIFILGFIAGSLLQRRIGLGQNQNNREEQYEEQTEDPQEDSGEPLSTEAGEETARPDATGFLDAASLENQLSVDAEYVVKEKDILRGTIVETVSRLPDKYAGMDLEQFTQALEIYAKNPPLSEKERGFQGLQVVSFARERVVIEMEYRYVQPGTSFYLALRDNELVVLLEDKSTVYIATGISSDRFDKEMIERLMNMIYVEDEAALFDILEAYSS